MHGIIMTSSVGFILPYQGRSWLGRVTRQEMPGIDSFVSWAMLNRDGVVGVGTWSGGGAPANEIEFAIASVKLEGHLLPDSTVEVGTLGVGLKEAVVDLGPPMSRKRHNVRDNRGTHKRVALGDEGTGGSASEGAVGGAATGEDACC